MTQPKRAPRRPRQRPAPSPTVRDASPSSYLSGDQPDNKNTPPLITIEEVIQDFVRRQNHLIEMLEAEDTPPHDRIRAFALYSQNASRLGRLLRDQRALSGQAADGISAAIAQALDELGTELGQPL